MVNTFIEGYNAIITNITEPHMTALPKIYIASPYWNDDPNIREENVNRQRLIAVTLIELGYAPFWPLHSHFLATTPAGKYIPEAQWLDLSLSWIGQCDALLRLEGTSRGADAEVEKAHDLGIPVLFNVAEVVLHFPRKEVNKDA